MSNRNGNNNGQTATTDISSGSKQNDTETAKAKIGRQTIQDRIFRILSAHPKGLEASTLEAEGQKLRTVPKGRYMAVGVSEFAIQKEGDRTMVFPQVSERGYRSAIRCATQRNWLHWIARNYPEETVAQAVTDKLDSQKLEILRSVIANKKQKRSTAKAKTERKEKDSKPKGTPKATSKKQTNPAK